MPNSYRDRAMMLDDGTLRRIGKRVRKVSMNGAGEPLVAEACTRRWFLRRQVPCWSDPTPPGSPGRYGLLFRGGRRAMVIPSLGATPILTFDRMMKARCDYLIPVRLVDGKGGAPEGFLFWYDLPHGGRKGIEEPIRLSTLLRRDMETFPELIERPGHFRTACLMGALRLLVRGEPTSPTPIDPGGSTPE